MQKHIFKKNQFLICLTLLFALSGCEGIDDWSDLKNIDLFNNKEENTQNAFKRYNKPELSETPIVEFIVDDNVKYSKIYNNEIRKICDYTKFPFNSISIKNWNASPKIASTTRVISIFETKKISDASILKLIDFVSNGGTLFLPYVSEDNRMGFLYGFKSDADFSTDVKSAGWFFSTPMLPTMKGKTYLKDLIFYGYSAKNFSNNVKILATAANNPNYPSVIENPIGTGRVIIYNTSGELLKADRGFMFAGLLKGLEGMPYPIANTSTIFLDDFPSPQYDIKAEPIETEMNMMTSDFVPKVWWPDMQALAKEYNISYAAMLTFDYRNKIVPPFTLDQWNTRKIKVKEKVFALTEWLVSDVKKNHHELAFHGYNHVSLTKELWKNQQFIETSMNTIKKKWDLSDYGSLPTSYVPPSNIIDKDGLKQLKKSMPSIKYICSLYLGQPGDGGNREFDYDPYNKDFFDYPRILSGFYFDDENKYNQQSLYLFTGIWTHFVHPDDVYQIPATANASAGHYELRNSLNYGWHKTKGSDKAMFPEFKKYIKQMSNSYPQLRFVNANDGANLVMNWRASRFNRSAQNGIYTLKQINGDEVAKQYWFMYGSPKNASSIESRLNNRDVIFSKTPFMDGFLYSIYTNSPTFSVLDLKFKDYQQKIAQTKANQKVKSDFSAYIVGLKKYKNGDIWVDDSDKKFKLELVDLKNKMLNTPVIDSVTWNKYAKYLSWDNKGDEVWKMLEEHVIKYPTRDNVMYSKELDRIIGYPNDLVKEKWMNAQLLVTPNDKDLLNSYVANFYTDENQEKIGNALKTLLAVDTSEKSFKDYLRYLLQYKPEEAKIMLNDRKPTEEFAEFATQIVWLYADNNEFQKAYDWSLLSSEIDFESKLKWLIELKQNKLLETEYSKYSEEVPNDFKVKALMCSYYHGLGRFTKAWTLANSLPESTEKEDLRKTFNRDVVYEDIHIQEYLIANQPELFYPDVLKKLIRDNRKSKGDFIDSQSELTTNQTETAVQKNFISYNKYDKKSNLHSFSIAYNKFYKLKIPKKYSSNFDNSLMGIQYKFTTAQKEGKPQYWGKAGVEVDKATKPYYTAGLGWNSSKGTRFRSAEFNFFPVETAPAMNQKLYNLRLNLYQNFYVFKKINTSISFEGNYYTSGFLSKDTLNIDPIINPNRFSRTTYTAIDNDTYSKETSDDALDGAITLKMMLDDGVIRKSLFVPFIEAQHYTGSRNLSNGFPYWMIPNRTYGGGGLGWAFNKTNFQSKIEAGYFLDDYSKNFKRLSANILYQIFDFTGLTLNVELFSQEKYYSNSVQLGLKYNLKKKLK